MLLQLLPYFIIVALLLACWLRRPRTAIPASIEQDLLVGAIEQLESGFVLYSADDRLVICNQKFRDLYPEVAELLRPGVAYADIARAYYRKRRGSVQFSDEERTALRAAGHQPAYAWANEDEYVALRCELHKSSPSSDYEWVERGRHYLASDRVLRSGVVVGLRIDITERKQAEEALRKSERFIRAVANGLPGMVAYWTPELRCAFANHAYFEWFGRPPEQMLGISMQELKTPELFAADEPFVRGALAGQPQAFERSLTKPSGEIGHTWTQYIPDLVDGQVQGVFVLVSDITRVKQAEQAQQRSNTLLEATQAMAQVGGIEVDLVNNKVFLTDEVYRIFELSRETHTPSLETTVQFFTEASRPVIMAAVEESTRTGIPYDLELPMTTATGRPIWVHTKNTVTTEGGRVVRRTAVLQDITSRRQAEEALRTSEELLRQITSQLPGVVYRLLLRPDGSRQYRYVSPGVRDLYGLEPEQLMADGNLAYNMTHPEDRARMEADADAADDISGTLAKEFRIVLADGSIKWVQMTSSAFARGDEGVIRTGVALDITARKAAELALREQDEMWKLALESTGDGVWDWHVQTGDEFYSRRCKEMYGYADDEIMSRFEELDGRTHPDDLPQMYRDRQAHFEGRTPTYVNEHRVRCKDGSWKWIQSRGMVIRRDGEGKPLRMIGTHTDITARKEAESLIWQQANFDALTGLPNRRMLRDRLQQDLRKCRREKLRLALLFIDLDHFKEVNDTLGHDRGDLLLIEAARRIRECVRESDTVARMGGDEFTVVLPELAETGHVERIVQNIIASLARVFPLGEDQAFVSASIGVTLYPDDGQQIEDLLRHADQALYVAKDAGRNRFSYFTPELQQAAQMRVSLANDLRHALADRQLELYYQPVIDLRSGVIRKAEALLRWHHPQRGMVSPAHFIPIAESSGLIIEIGNWVFEQALAQVQRWRATAHPDFQISINKSPVQFHAEGQSQSHWLEQMQAKGLPGASIAIEITEGLLLDASASVIGQLLELRDAGVGVSLDDFGTGYSSLSYLQKYDIDYIKIDQSFVRNLKPDSRDMALCNAMIVMAHELGMKVIAEGVETPQQRALLTAAGCDYGQGYLFARPMPVADLDRLLAKG